MGPFQAAAHEEITDEQKAKFRDLIKPLVLEMHRMGIHHVEINKDGGKVDMKLQREPKPQDAELSRTLKDLGFKQRPIYGHYKSAPPKPKETDG